MPMKRLSEVAIFMVLACWLAHAADPFTLSVSLPAQVMKAGSSVKIEIVLRNISDHDLRFVTFPVADAGAEAAAINFSAAVVDSDGNAAPYTALGERLMNSALSYSMPVAWIVEAPNTCGPDKKRYSRTALPQWCPFCTDADIKEANRKCGASRISFDIGKLFDLSKPAKYTIQISKYVADRKQFVNSNKVVATITP